MPAEPPEYVMVPVALIHTPVLPGLRRRTITAGEAEAFARTITANGEVAHPLTVRPGPKGGYELIDGQVRLAAAKHRGDTHVLCRVRDLTDEEAVRVAHVLNVSGRKPPSDLRRAWDIVDTLRVLDVRPIELVEISCYTGPDISESRTLASLFPRNRVEAHAADADMSIDQLASMPRDALRDLKSINDTERRVSELLTMVRTGTGRLRKPCRSAEPAIAMSVACVPHALLASLTGVPNVSTLTQFGTVTGTMALERVRFGGAAGIPKRVVVFFGGVRLQADRDHGNIVVIGNGAVHVDPGRIDAAAVGSILLELTRVLLPQLSFPLVIRSKSSRIFAKLRAAKSRLRASSLIRLIRGLTPKRFS